MEKEITINDISIHAKSKKEIYHVLTVEGGIYLPPMMDANKKYIQNIMRGHKKFLYTKNVKIAKVPQINKLSIKSILKWGYENTDIDSYLPSYDYDKYPNRDWIWNVLNTIAHDKFQTLIKETLKDREKMIVMKSRLNVEAIPEIVNIFAKSQNVSVSKGKSHFLMRGDQGYWKRKHPDEEMKVDNDQLKIIEELSHKITSLEEKIDDYAKNEHELLLDREKLVKLYQEGVIDSDGEPKD